MSDDSLDWKEAMSVVVVTYGRERVLVESLRRILDLRPGELIVVDQTSCHEPDTAKALLDWVAAGEVRLLSMARPSIPKAMNAGLLAAQGEIVLFLDDDVVPDRELLKWHGRAHALHTEAGIVTGQVLQPGQEPEPLRESEPFRFNSTEAAWIDHTIACNMSVKRAIAIAVGGFDENFVGAAYHFESEFAIRIVASGCRVAFEPRASLRHLRAERGGTRVGGSHLTTFGPHHAVGVYYHELATGRGPGGIVRHFVRSVWTRHHLRAPWWIPATLIAQTRGLLWALRLWLSGPKRLRPHVEHG